MANIRGNSKNDIASVKAKQRNGWLWLGGTEQTIGIDRTFLIDWHS